MFPVKGNLDSTFGLEPITGSIHPAFDEIHRRSADEAGHETIRWMSIDIQRRSDLLNHTIFHHHHSVTEGHRLFLVMGHVDAGGGDGAMKFLQLTPHVIAQLRIEVAEWFIEQETGWLTNQRSAEGHPLLLSTTHLRRPAVQELLDAQLTRRGLDAFITHGSRHLSQLESELHVGPCGLVGIQRVVLEDHRDVPILGGNLVHDTITDANRPGGQVFKTRHHSQQGGLATSRRTHQNHELTIPDVQ